jgi:hypothetical protein
LALDRTPDAFGHLEGLVETSDQTDEFLTPEARKDVINRTALGVSADRRNAMLAAACPCCRCMP